MQLFNVLNVLAVADEGIVNYEGVPFKLFFVLSALSCVGDTSLAVPMGCNYSVHHEYFG